jgi:hypothetical protein
MSKDNNPYNLRPRNNIKKPNKYFNTNMVNDIENLDTIEYEYKGDKNINEFDATKLKDKYLPPLHKKYFRPYFSPYTGSWEIDFLELIYNKKEYLYYLFVVNINTKYLYVEDSITKDANIVKNIIGRMENEGLYIDNIRGDAERGFISTDTAEYLDNRGIRYYFTPNLYINRSRVVDRVIRTIRDMIDKLGTNASIFDNDLVKRVVKRYNNTYHKAFNYMFTPLQVQMNPRIEAIYIWDKMKQLKVIRQKQEKGIGRYKPGDILLVHIPIERKLLSYKRRRNFTHLAAFISYDHGNVRCIPTHPENNIGEVVLPIYYTQALDPFQDEEIRNYFNFKK